MIEQREYTCGYCRVPFVPKRRGVQKYCSNSCRVRAHQIKKRALLEENEKQEKTTQSSKIKIDQMSISGVGNAVTGTAAVMAINRLCIFRKKIDLQRKKMLEMLK